MYDSNSGKPLPIPVATMFKFDEVKLVPRTEVAEHLNDGWKIVAGTPTVQS